MVALSLDMGGIAEVVRTPLNDSGVTAEECGGIAIGFPGIVDVQNDRILSTLNKYEDAIHLGLGRWTIEQLSLRIENDAGMALLGELYAGAVRGAQNAVMIMLGARIGGAHMPVNYRGQKCACGNRGQKCACGNVTIGEHLGCVRQCWVEMLRCWGQFGCYRKILRACKRR
jgi:predicted NBD/HSP70 family sugar kinase